MTNDAPTANQPYVHSSDAVHVFAGEISLEQYLGQHGKKTDYCGERAAILAGATAFMPKLNQLLEAMRADGVVIEYQTNNYMYLLSPLTSGWRPEAYNLCVKGASARSWHIKGKAGDLYDPNGALDDWCMSHLDVLARIGLWLEHPSSTKGWCHVQDEPPHSGNRVFYP